MKFSSKIMMFVVSTLLFVAFNNCSNVAFSPIDNSAVVPTGDGHKLVISPSEGFVCSPFGTNTAPSDKSGLKAELRYVPLSSGLSASEKNAFASTEYFNDGNAAFVKVATPLYLQDVNVPTRRFEAGFVNSDGTLLKDADGRVLDEYFALKMESVLVLAANDLEGYYELATVSDDGTVVQILEDGAWVNLISNDGAHSTKMGCATNSHKIKMTKTTRLPIRIFYNQGPRTQIANVLVWNYRGATDVTATDVSSDSDIRLQCGKASNEEFWKSSNSSVGPWFQDMLDKKWTILIPANFQLPDNEVNPCSFTNSTELAPELSTLDMMNFTLALAKSASIEVKIYKIESDGSKTLVQSLTRAFDVHHDFAIPNLDVMSQYKVDIVATLRERNVRILTDYTLKFVAD